MHFTLCKTSTIIYKRRTLITSIAVTVGGDTSERNGLLFRYCGAGATNYNYILELGFYPFSFVERNECETRVLCIKDRFIS